MFIVPVRKHHGFTLLEIVLAVAILGLMSVAIYRFVQSNIVALQVSSEATAADATAVSNATTLEPGELTPASAKSSSPRVRLRKLYVQALKGHL